MKEAKRFRKHHIMWFTKINPTAHWQLIREVTEQLKTTCKELQTSLALVKICVQHSTIRKRLGNKNPTGRLEKPLLYKNTEVCQKNILMRRVGKYCLDWWDENGPLYLACNVYFIKKNHMVWGWFRTWTVYCDSWFWFTTRSTLPWPHAHLAYATAEQWSETHQEATSGWWKKVVEWSIQSPVFNLTEMSWHALKWVTKIKQKLPPRLEHAIKF